MVPGLVLGLVLIALAFGAVDGPVAAAPADAPPVAMAQSITRLSNTPVPGTPQADGTVVAMVQWGSQIVLGGTFTEVGGQVRNGLASLDISTRTLTPWSPTIDRMDEGDFVGALLVMPDGDLIVAGRIAAVNGHPRLNVARFAPDGSLLPDDFGVAGDAYGSGPRVFSLAASGETLLVGGDFTTAVGRGGIGPEERRGLAAFDLAAPTQPVFPQWNPEADNSFPALLVDGDSVFIGGRGLRKVSLPDGQPVPGFTPEVGMQVSAMVLAGGVLRVAWIAPADSGGPTLGGLDPATGAATAWQPGMTPGGTATTLAVRDGNLLVGGLYSELAGSPRSRLGAVPLTGNGRPADPWTPTAPGWGPNAPLPILSLDDAVVVGSGPSFYEPAPEAFCLFGGGGGAVLPPGSEGQPPHASHTQTSALPVVVRACAGAW